jgi:dTDP-4-dehydrorhamnose reductase
VWGGIECSVVRIGDRWRDQIRETGHEDRAATDIPMLAGMGIRTLRYPLLWERSVDSRAGAGWQWQDRQLAALERHGIQVVAGLVHHGSGPSGTHLLDPLFPEKLAQHATSAIERHPTLRAWTPINEPLTTARFACLYGYWYPHVRSEVQFVRAVANQCRAVLLAMRAIRGRVPGACFVHTEDIGRVFSTPPIAAQAAYENERRWLSLDLLCGRIDRSHPWRAELESRGVPAGHLDELATGEAAPDLIGVNHYVTSDRFLDHRLALYPKHAHGGNGRLFYVDTEAARASMDPNAVGWEPRLREVWQRYRRPMAVTEVHLGCADPMESVRWLMEAWNAVHTLRAEGARIDAITPWGLLGLVDWDSMLRECRGHYEAGAWDTSLDTPRPTVLAEAISSLAHTGTFTHPGLEEPGWWRREEGKHPRLRGS